MNYFNFYILIVVSVHCGDSYRRLEKKIIHGRDVSITKHPHAVFLQILTDDSIHICGSSILNQHYLITVAHCVYTSYDERFHNIGKQVNAFAGHENINKALAYRRVKRVLIHTKYCPITVYNDIALLLLAKALPLGQSIKRIILRPSFPSNARGTLTGWGFLNEITEEQSITLKAISQTVKPKSRCNTVGITRSSFCAGSHNESSPRAAGGDSGSGLVTSTYQLLGLVSFKLISHPALPVYTNVSYYYRWIKRSTKIAFCRSLLFPSLNSYNSNIIHTLYKVTI